MKHVLAPMHISRMSRQRADLPPPTPTKKDSTADAKALKNTNEILKDKSADCKPRDVRKSNKIWNERYNLKIVRDDDLDAGWDTKRT